MHQPKIHRLYRLCTQTQATKLLVAIGSHEFRLGFPWYRVVVQIADLLLSILNRSTWKLSERADIQ